MSGGRGGVVHGVDKRQSMPTREINNKHTIAYFYCRIGCQRCLASCLIGVLSDKAAGLRLIVAHESRDDEKGAN